MTASQPRSANDPLRLAVLASHGGSNMQAVIDNIQAGLLNARIMVVISNNSACGAVERARKAGIPTLHLSGQTHPDPQALDLAIRDAIVGSGAELVLLAGYMKKIGPATLAALPGRILNIHPALLPRHGGAGLYGIHPHEAVLAAGDTESGATVHVIDEEYDRGAIVAQRRVPVLAGDTPQTLQERVLKVEHEIYSQVLQQVIDGQIPLPILT